MTPKTFISILIFLLAFAVNNDISAQSVENRCDTVNIIAPAYLVLEDTTIHLLHDSTSIICKKYIVITKKNGYSLYSKIVGESKKHKLVDKLFQALIASSTQDTMLIQKELFKAEDAYKPYSGKVIRNIKIQVLKPFGASISDTNLPVVSSWGKALNHSHISTNKNTIRRKLMFKENDTINPYEFVENTNELAGLPYLQDATIVVSNADGDSVDVLILAKDKFPWLPAADFHSINKINAYLTNVNILGRGHSLRAGLTMDTKSSPVIYLSDINYSINNIYKQLSGAFNYNISDFNQMFQVSLNRNIIPLSIRLGGGMEITQKEENISIDPTYIDQSSWYFKYRHYELWTSYLFYDKTKKNMDDDNLSFFIPGIATYKKDYLYRPYVSIDSNNQFANYTQLLGNFAVVKQNYYRTNFLKSFGKAEYVPYGFQAIITGGYTWSQFMNKPYIGLKLSILNHFKDVGYINAKLDIGSHFSTKFNQGALNTKISFLTNTFKHNRYRYRIMSFVNYTTGINRFTNDMIYLGEDYGFIGMNDKVFYGQERLFAELYGISYTPWYMFGFRFAVFAFCSGGYLGDEKLPLMRNQFLSSFGIGIYSKNDFLAFNSFQVRVAYFPITPNGISHFGISFSTLGLFEDTNFLNTKPQIVEYK